MIHQEDFFDLNSIPDLSNFDLSVKDCILSENEQYIFMTLLFEEEMTRLIFRAIYNKNTKIFSNEEQGIFFNKEIKRIFKNTQKNTYDYICFARNEIIALNLKTTEKSHVYFLYF